MAPRGASLASRARRERDYVNYYRGNFPHQTRQKTRSFLGSGPQRQQIPDFKPLNYQEYIAGQSLQQQAEQNYFLRVMALDKAREDRRISDRDYQLEIAKLDQEYGMFQEEQQQERNLATQQQEADLFRTQTEGALDQEKQETIGQYQLLAKEMDEVGKFARQGNQHQYEINKTVVGKKLDNLGRGTSALLSAMGSIGDEDLSEFQSLANFLEAASNNLLGSNMAEYAERYEQGDLGGGGGGQGGATLAGGGGFGGGGQAGPSIFDPTRGQAGGQVFQREEPITYETRQLEEEQERRLAEAGGPIELPRSIRRGAVSNEQVADLIAQYPGREAELAEALGVSVAALKRVGAKGGKREEIEKISPFVAKPQEPKEKAKAPRGTFQYKIGGATFYYNPETGKFTNEPYVPSEEPGEIFKKVEVLPPFVPPEEQQKVPAAATPPPPLEYPGAELGKGIRRATTQFDPLYGGYEAIATAKDYYENIARGALGLPSKEIGPGMTQEEFGKTALETLGLFGGAAGLGLGAGAGISLFNKLFGPAPTPPSPVRLPPGVPAGALPPSPSAQHEIRAAQRIAATKPDFGPPPVGARPLPGAKVPTLGPRPSPGGQVSRGVLGIRPPVEQIQFPTTAPPATSSLLRGAPPEISPWERTPFKMPPGFKGTFGFPAVSIFSLLPAILEEYERSKKQKLFKELSPEDQAELLMRQFGT